MQNQNAHNHQTGAHEESWGRRKNNKSQYAVAENAVTDLLPLKKLTHTHDSKHVRTDTARNRS